jgi:hypothetical protein
MKNQNLAESHKKSQAGIIVLVVLIIVIFAGAIIVWNIVHGIIRKSPPEADCLSFLDLGSIENACYLDNNQLKLILKTNFNDIEIKKISIYFSPSNSYWEITGKNCSDVKMGNNPYGYECQLPLLGETKNYILNMTNLSIQDQVNIYFGINNSLCKFYSAQIINSC